MRKQLAAVVLVMVLCAGLGSSALLTRAMAQSTRLSAIQQEKQLGPKPTPRWYWRWQAWHLGEGYAKGHRLQHQFRPQQAPQSVPRWAWRRLHFFLLARVQRTLANSGKRHQHGQPPPTTTGTTTTATTATSTTTTTTTTTTPIPSSGGETYDAAISYTQTPPPFTPARVIDVNDATSFKYAIANLQAGDLVKATGDFTVGGETVINERLSAPAVIDLTGHSVKFVYSGGQNLPAVWLNNAQNVRIYGGDLSTADSGGTCLLDHGSQHVLWWGFSLHDCGGSGFGAFTVGAAVDDNDFQGTITKVGQNLAWDPHAEKGTGLHGAILWDASTSYAFTNNRFAFYAHDIPVGACVSLGNPVSASASGNVLYEKCVNETEVSTIQTGGNGLQLWGYTNNLGLDVKYLEVDNAEGRGLQAGGLYSGQSAHGVILAHATASNTNQNTNLNDINSSMIWDTRGGVVYQDVQPSP